MVRHAGVAVALVLAMNLAACGDDGGEPSVDGSAGDLGDAASSGDGASNDAGDGSAASLVFHAIASAAVAAESGRPIEVQADIEMPVAADALPLSFYLVLDSSFDLTKEGDEIPEQYYLGSLTLLDVAAGRGEHTATLTIPAEVVSGEYTLIGYADPDSAAFEGGDEEARIARADKPLYIANKEQVADLMATSLEFDNDAVEVEDDGTIHLSGVVVLKAEIAEATDVTVRACVEVGAECKEITIWDGLTDGSVLTLDGPIEKDTETRVGFDVKMTPQVAQDLVQFLLAQLLQDPFVLFKAAKVRVLVESKDETAATKDNNTITVSIPYYRDLRYQAGVSTLDYKKKFKSSRYGKKFGGGVELEGRAQFNKDGLFASVNGDVKLKILGKTESVLESSATVAVEPGSFEDTGYDLSVKVFGVSVYTQRSSLADQIPDPSSTEKERKKRYLQNKVTMKKYSGTTQSAVSYARNWDIGKKKGHTQTLWVSIVPVVVSAGAQATVGLNASIQLEGITALSAALTPNVKVGAYASGGVGNSLYSAGLESSFYFMDENFEAKTTASLTLEEDAAGENIVSLNGNLRETIINTFRGPRGSLYIYGKYSVVKWCKKWKIKYPCGFRKKTRRRYLAKWETKKKTKTILDKRQTAFVIPLD